jgi:hypothetical protein
MRTIGNRRLRGAIYATLTLLASASQVFAYPPDNAAVLYYRACQWYRAEPETEQMLSDLSSGRIELNEEIRKLVKNNERAINFAIDASGVTNCDWGMDYSKGMAAVLPPLHTFKQLARLIIADAEIMTEKGDYKSAIGRCLSVERFARHVSDRNMMNYLFGLAINGEADKCMQDILATMPEDLEMLIWLKNQLAQIDGKSFSFENCVEDANESALSFMIEDNMKGLLPIENWEVPPSVSKTAEKWIRAADERFLAGNLAYWKRLIAHIEAAVDMPYTKAYAELKRLCEKPEKDIIENPNATLTLMLLPAFDRSYSVGIRGENLPNAIRAAVEVYIVKARTGQLPDVLPSGLPKDLFGGEDFEYKKTKGGFVLRCRAKDMDKGKFREYEFKVIK